MIFTDHTNPVSLSDSEQVDLVDEHLAYDKELMRSGHFIHAQALQPIETATFVKVRSGKLSVTDGPFIETRDQLTGFFVIEARDLNEAIQLAAKIPSARYGYVEIRPVRELLEEQRNATAK
jgi:hypothetical protein